MDPLADGPLALAMDPQELTDRLHRMAGTAHPSEVIAANGSRNGQLKPPTRLRGYVEDAAFDSLLADMLETVRDVAWPQSVQTYQQMRHDAKLTSIVDGHSLQIERATWQLDGTGCRPEVVELVADDMDLPVKGTDRPGAARTRGVSWPEHLRGALTMLAFGHSGFELQADTSSGRARLVGLWDRPQHTIEQIHVDPATGRFTGISQELALGPFDAPEIKADRLAWYAHRREGAQHYGRSLLRPAFAPWLFKREMMRVLATSSRRFGMGVPVARWPESANPTPQQISKAQEMASAARVGDTSGAAMPPGAWLELVGLSGGVPDTLAFVKWLDQQMSVSVLMQHLDLGQTQTGSRALGESFIDSWMLALETIGSEVADAATRQVAARIVGWNWGLDEPVPKVTVSGIGSRREVTAESLKVLLDSGALDADPALKEWVRREFRLPEPDPDQPAPTRPLAPQEPQRRQVQAAAPTPAPARPATPVRYEQPELPIDAAGDHWRTQPRRKDVGLNGGQWVERGGGVPSVGRAATGALRTVGELLDVAGRLARPDPDDDDGEGQPRRRTTPAEVREVHAELRSAADDIFAGSFGNLLTEVTMVDTVDGAVQVQGNILDAEGVEVGQFERGFYVDGESNLVARHEMLDLAPQVQGGGFATEFNAHLERWYEQSGVRYISLKANIDVGGYAWARAGYEYADGKAYSHVMFRLYGATLARSDAADRATDLDAASRLRAEAEAGWDLLERAGVPRYDQNFDFSGRGDFDDSRWDDPSAPTPYEVSQVGRPPGGGRDVQWLGKDVLLGSGWEGVRWL